MNKKDILLIVGVLVAVVSSMFLIGGTNANKIDLPLALSGEETGTIEIDYPTYEKKVADKDNFIVIIERTDCSYCKMYMPVVEEVSEELNIPVYFINTDNISEEEYNKLNDTNSYLKRNRWGTPTTLLMSGSIVLRNIGGYVEKDEFVKFIEDNIILDKQEEKEEQGE